MPIPNGGGGFQLGDGNTSEPQLSPQASPASATVTTTLTPDQLISGLIIANPGTANATYTLPTSLDLCTAVPSVAKINSSFNFTIINQGSASATITIATNTGWSLSGTMTVAPGTSQQFKVRKSGTQTWAIYPTSTGYPSVQFNKRPPAIRFKPIAELAMGDFNSSTFFQNFQVPFTGPCMVRALYETDNAAVTCTITATSFARSRALAHANPLNAAGTAAAWSVVGSTALSQASASLATDGVWGQGASAFAFVDVPAATDSGVGGYIQVRTYSTAPSKRCQVSAASANYETHVSPLLTNMKYRAGYSSTVADFCTTNQAAMVEINNGFSNNYHGCLGIDVIPLAPASYIPVFGDSQEAGYGTNVTVAPMGYAPVAVMANSLTSSGTAFTFANYGSAGKGAAYFRGRLVAFLADTRNRPPFVIIKPFSVNDGFTDSAINAGLALAMQSASDCMALGIQPIFMTVTPPASNNTAQQTARLRGNTFVRNSGIPYIDSDLLLSNTAVPPQLATAYNPGDNLHYNMTGDNVIAAQGVVIVKGK